MSKTPTVYDCSFIELPKISFPEGNLTYIYNDVHLPFEVKRVFYSYDIPGGEDRELHRRALRRRRRHEAEPR